ncbi:MAG: ATP-binding cassette domain-containing protein [Verrucomicrobiaceae bacterium]|nr:ATP-binding cassette domain-containing protein [Verrucomicrobiaceae bacterium]
MIEFTDVTKTFPGMERPAVDGLTLSVKRGETLVLLGSSGCGKSTLLKLANRLLEPDAGEIRIGGRAVATWPVRELRRSIGYVIQNIGLFPHWTAEENVAAPLRIAGVAPEERRGRSRELLDRIGLASDEYAGRYPDELSGGQQQRVGVARALASDPEILLMDEPFGALDGITRERLQDEVRRLKGDLGKTILLVTHDLFEALALGDRIGVMHEGRLEQAGPARELLSAPATPFVEELFKKPARQLEAFGEAGGASVAKEGS